jgi:hypothetical protein
VLVVKIVLFIASALFGYGVIAAISGVMLSSRVSRMEENEHKSK